LSPHGHYLLCIMHQVQLTPLLGRSEMDYLERIHFRALHVVVRDCKQRMNRDLISVKTNRLPPKLWSKFSCASTQWSSRLIPSPTRLSNWDILDCYLDMTHRKPKLVNKWQGTGVEEFYPKLNSLGQTIQLLKTD